MDQHVDLELLPETGRAFPHWVKRDAQAMYRLYWRNWRHGLLEPWPRFLQARPESFEYREPSPPVAEPTSGKNLKS